MSNFFRRGTTKFFWVPTIAVKTAPTAAEVNAGNDMSPKLNDIAGFSFSNSPIPTPNMAEAFTPTIPGEDTAEDSTLTFLEDKTTNALQTTLAKGTAGFVVIFWGGIAGAIPAAADKAEVWPVITTGFAREYTVGTDPAKWHCGFTPSATPAQSAVLT